MLVYSAADFEDFKVERPEMPPSMESDLKPVVRLLAENRWPWRLHATYNETITRALDVFEKVNRLGVTGVIDAGGGFQNYPDDYRIIEELHREGHLTVRLAYNLFTQKPKEELKDFDG